MKKRSSAAGGKANENEEWRMKNEELSASPIKKQGSVAGGKANENEEWRMENCRLRRLRNRVRRPEEKPIIQFRVYCPKESKCHALARFVLFVRLVFEKHIGVWIILSWPRDLSKPHWPKGSNLPNQTNHVICRQNQKTNPSKIPVVLSRRNQNQNAWFVMLRCRLSYEKIMILLQ